MSIYIQKMTKQLMRQFFIGFQYDPYTFSDSTTVPSFIYSDTFSDQFWDKEQAKNRIHLAAMHHDSIIGDICLKEIDYTNRCCTFSIHLQNDSFKNLGYGTQAEILALKYAFHNLEMDIVYADALIKNIRSRHVLQKVGFSEIGRDLDFCYFHCKKPGL